MIHITLLLPLLWPGPTTRRGRRHRRVGPVSTELSHVDETGAARMVDVSEKQPGPRWYKNAAGRRLLKKGEP